jgi:hypothetical protein
MNTIPLFIDSATCEDVTLNGSRIKINLDNAIILRKGAKLRVIESTIYYSFPNVSEEFGNNLIDFSYDSILYSIQFEKGIYTISALNLTIQEYFKSNGLPSNLFSIVPDNSTFKSSIYINPVSKTFTLNALDPGNKLMRETLGFNQNYSTNIDDIYEADFNTALNNITAVYLHGDMVSGGNTYYNGNNSNVIHKILLTNAPGESNSTIPIHPTWHTINKTSITSMTFYLLDQNLNPIDMNGETFSFIAEIAY